MFAIPYYYYTIASTILPIFRGGEMEKEHVLVTTVTATTCKSCTKNYLSNINVYAVLQLARSFRRAVSGGRAC